MANVNVRLKIRGINELMTSRPVTELVVREARRMAAEAGPNFEADIVPHKWTARAYVRPANAAGAREQAENAVLERVIR